jgi:hypothetical protein
MCKTFLFSVAFLLLLSGCVYHNILLTPVVLKKGDVYNLEHGLLISLDSVLEDSRCPANALCIWAGNAKVRLAFFDGEFWNRFVLNSDFQNEIVMYGYRIKLINLSPYPITNVAIQQSDYKVELLIMKE